MSNVRVVVTRSHRYSMDRFVEVGEVIDLPEAIAIERIHNGAVKLAPPEPAPADPVVEDAAPAAGEPDQVENGDPAEAASAASAADSEPAPPAADPSAPASLTRRNPKTK